MILDFAQKVIWGSSEADCIQILRLSRTGSHSDLFKQRVVKPPFLDARQSNKSLDDQK